MLRVVFMGTPDFAVPSLERLHPLHQIVGVYTQPDRPVGRGLDLRASPVKTTAERLGIPVFQPERLSAPGEFERLQELRPDLIVVVAFGQILKQNVLDIPRLGCVNIHSSLLPRWRGAAPIQRAIIAGDAFTGVTTMKLVLKLDAGDILLQEKTPISPDDTAGTLHVRLARLGSDLIVKTLERLDIGTLLGEKQDETKVTYAEKLAKSEEWIDPSLTAEVLDRRIRALNPWPGTSIRVEDPAKPGTFQRLKIKQTRLWPSLVGPTSSLFERNGMILLGTPSGCLELLRVQWEGKKEVDAAGFLNGLHGRGHKLPLKVSV